MIDSDTIQDVDWENWLYVRPSQLTGHDYKALISKYISYGRFTVHDPVRRVCNQSRRIQFRWKEVS